MGPKGTEHMLHEKVSSDLTTMGTRSFCISFNIRRAWSDRLTDSRPSGHWFHPRSQYQQAQSLLDKKKVEQNLDKQTKNKKLFYFKTVSIVPNLEFVLDCRCCLCLTSVKRAMKIENSLECQATSDTTQLK